MFNHFKFKKISIFLGVFLMFFLYSFASAAGTPPIISYQGRLADGSGNLLGGSGTTYYFKFSIWDNPTVGSGSQQWPATSPSSFASNVRSGVFNVNIGDTANGFPNALDYDFNTQSNVYLQVEVSSDNSSFQTLTPRQRIASTPFARLSGAVSGSTTPSSFGTTTPFGTSVVSIEATSTNTVGLTIRSVLNQLANIFQVQDSTGSNLLSVNSAGTLSVSGLTFLNQASSTIFSALDSFSVGRTATTTIRGEVNATSTFAGGVSASYVNISGTSATSTISGGLTVSGGIKLTSLASCTGASTLDTDASGNIICGSDTGGVGAQTPWTSNIDGGGYSVTNGGSFTFTNFTATSTTAISSVAAFFGIGTTTPGTMLGVQGNAVVAGNVNASSFTATSTSASSTLQNLSFSNAFGTSLSASALSASTICFVGDVCRTTWPTGSSGLSYNPFTAGAFVATSTATSTFAAGLEAFQIGTSRIFATSTTASSSLQNFSFTNAQGTSITLSGGSTIAGALSIGSLTNAGVITNANLANSSVTVTAGSGLIGGGSVALGASITLANGLSYSPFTAGAFIATGTATSTFASGLEATIIGASRIFATSTTASSSLTNFSFTNGQGTSLSASALSASTICIVGDACRTSWPTGGGGGSSQWATSTVDSLAIYTAGGTRVGIGTSSPLSVLTLSATSSLSNLSLFSVWAEASAGATTTAFTILSNGNVGIGTSAPAGKFSVEGGGVVSINTAGNITGAVAGTIDLVLRNNYALGGLNADGTNSQSLIKLNTSNETVIGSANITIFNERLKFASDNALDFGDSGAARARTIYVGTSVFSPLLVGGTAVDSVLSLKSTSGVGTTDAIKFLVGNNGGTEAMRILSSGNVGVGSSTPWARLSVSATSSLTNLPLFAVATSSLTSTSTAFFIDSNGRVGIGTTSPSVPYSLSVSGPIYSASGTSTLSNLLFANGQGTSLSASALAASTICIVGDTCRTSWPTLASAASTTLLADFNNFSGGNIFTYSGTTTYSGGIETPILGVSVIFATSTTASSSLTNFSFTNGQGTSLSASALSASTICIVGDSCRTTWPSGSGGPSDTKFSTSTADTLAIYMAGGTRAGFGTTSPLSVLSVSATSSLSNLSLFSIWAEASAGATTTALTVLSNGNVGLGTTTPGTMLSVQGSAVIAGSVNSSFFTATSSTATSTFSGGAIFATNGGSVGIGTTTPAWLTQIAGTRPFLALSDNAGGVDLKHWYLSSQNGNLYIGTTTDAYATSTATQQGLSILNSGYVGIGTSVPSNTLTVSINDFGGGIDLKGYTPSHTTIAQLIRESSVSGGGGKLILNNDSAAGKVVLRASGNSYFLSNNFGIGTTSPLSLLTVSATSSLSNLSLFSVWAEASAGATTTAFSILSNGNVGVGTTTPSARLSINQNSATTLGFYLAGFGNSTADLFRISTSTSSGTSTALYIDSNGRLAIGTTTISNGATLTVQGLAQFGHFLATSSSATSTIAGGLDIGNGNFVYDYSSGITSISSGQFGNLNFDQDAGAVSWADMMVTSTTPNNIIESYTAHINNNPVLTIFSQADGVTNVKNIAVGIGTTSPGHMLDILAGSTTPFTTGLTSNYYGLNVTNWATSSTASITKAGINITSTGSWSGTTASNIGLLVSSVTGGTNNYDAIFNGGGNVGIGTTSPFAHLAVVGANAPTNTSALTAFAVYGGTGGSGAAVGSGGGIVLVGGVGGSAGDGGAGGGIAITGGLGGIASSGDDGAGGSLSFTGGQGGTNNGNGDGGNVVITAGAGGSRNGGNVVINGGRGQSGAISGNIILASLSHGKVGVGSSTPWARLSVSATSSLSNLPLFAVSTSTLTSTSTAFFIDSNGKVGIGTTTPGGTFAVQGQVIAERLNTYSTTATSTIAGGLILSNGGLTLSTLNNSVCSGLGNSGKLTTDASGNVYCAEDVSGGGGGANTSKFSTSTADTLAIYMAGGTRAGFGTSSPPSVLTVSATSSLSNMSLFSVWNAASAGATTTAFSILSNGNVGVGTTTPSARLSINQNSATTLGFYLAGFGNSTADLFRISTSTSSGTSTALFIDSNGRLAIGTTTISNGATLTVQGLAQFGHLLATSSSATSTIAGGLDIGNGNFVYDYSSGISSVSTLQTGNLGFETNAGWVTWADLPFDNSVATGTVEAYSATINGSMALSIYSEAAGSGNFKNMKVVVGTSTSAVLSSSNISYGSFLVPDGALCVDDGPLTANNCATATRARGTIYAVAASVTANDLAEMYPASETVSAGDILMADPENAMMVKKYVTGTSATSTPPIFGVVSTEPGLTLGGFSSKASENVAVALVGRVPVKVIGTNGSIAIGDRITTSTTTPGFGVKAVHSGETVGFAIGSFIATSENDIGSVEVFVDRRFFLSPNDFELDPITGNLTFLPVNQATSTNTNQSTSTAMSTSTDSGLSIQSVIDYLASLGARISDGIAYFKKLVVESFTVGSPTKPTGITLYDDVTGEPYCLKIHNGQPTSTPGECDAATGSSTSTQTDPSTIGEVPVITINGNNPANTIVGSVYVDLGATVTDDKDDNLGLRFFVDSTKVTEIVIDTSVIGTHVVDYVVTDNDGNTATSTRTIIVSTQADSDTATTTPQNTSSTTPQTSVDTTAPVITMNGDASVSLNQGDQYIDAGATASDDVDGDITTDIVLLNSVNSAVTGVYEVTYNVEDASGNSATQVSRTVTVVALSPIIEGDTSTSTIPEL